MTRVDVTMRPDLDEMNNWMIYLNAAERAFAMAARLVRSLLASTWRCCRAPIGRTHRRTSYARAREDRAVLVLELVPQVTT